MTLMLEPFYLTYSLSELAPPLSPEPAVQHRSICVLLNHPFPLTQTISFSDQTSLSQ